MHALVLDVTVASGPRRRARLAGTLGHGELAVVRAEPADGAALARAMAVETPPGGQVVVGGTDVAALPPDERKIGYVPAGGALFPHLTLRRNIAYGLRGRPIAERFAGRRLDQASDRLALTPLLDLHPHEVTEDERLRAALARAAVQLPEVLVVDLPEALVDDGSGVRIKPVRLADLARAASLSESFDVATLVYSSDPLALAQVQVPLEVEVTLDPAPQRATAGR